MTYKSTTGENQQKTDEDTSEEDQERKALNELIKKGILELKPTPYDEEIHYEEAEKAWSNYDTTQVKKALLRLEKKGIVQSKYVDRILTCPDCGSPEVHSKYTCPKCSSHNVEYTELLEHMKCGYMDSKDKFQKGKSLICPSCQTRLVEEALHYRVIGNCFQCEKCGFRFDKPEIMHFCRGFRECRRTFTYQEAKYDKIFSYKITDETVKSLRSGQPVLESIEKIFTEKGYQVHLHPKITGASGVQHPFAILAEKNQTRIVIDVSITGNKNDMISLLGKKVDINPTGAAIIDLSKSNELTQLGKVYNITVFQATNEPDLQKHLSHFLTNLDSTETTISIAHKALAQTKSAAKKFYATEPPHPKQEKTRTHDTTELKAEIQHLEKKEQILYENLKILLEKKAIQAREKEIKAKKKALEESNSKAARARIELTAIEHRTCSGND